MNVLGNILSVAWLPVVLIIVVRILVAVLNSPRVKGKRGEKIVARKLQTGLPEGYVVLNDVYLPLPNGTTTQIDHIVVSPYGIFVVETKNYSGWIFAEADAKVWTQTIYHKKSTFQNPIRQNYLHVCAIADNLGIDRDYVRGVVVFVGGCTFKTDRPEGVVLADELVPYIKQFRNPMIKSVQVPEIAWTISEWQGTLADDTRKAHVANLNARHHGVSADDHPRCPRCGGEMVLRTAKSTGRRFFGCVAYPKCRGIVNVAD